MRSIFFICFLLICAAAKSQFIQNPLPFKQSDFKIYKTLGITKCSVYRTFADDTARTLVREAEYGAEGLLAVLIEKGTDDNDSMITTSEKVYKYDAKGRLWTIEENDEEYGNSKTLFTYNTAGKLTKKLVATIDPPTYTYTYDAPGKLIKIYSTQAFPAYDKNGEFTGKSVAKPSTKDIFKYDAKGRLSEQWSYLLLHGPNNNPPSKTKWFYNAKNQVTSVKNYNSEGNLMTQSNYTYNANGLVATEEITDLDSDPVTYIYEYCKGCVQSWMKN